MALAYWIPAAVLMLRAAVLGYFLGTESLDAKFFTYLNYIFGAFCYALLLLSQWSVLGYEVWVLFVLPVLWGTISFVSVAIIVIVHLNDGVFLKTTVDNAGERSVGEVHTGDWVLHQLPVVELLIVLLLLWPTASVSFRNFWRELRTPGRVVYTLYFLGASLLALGFYMVNVDFNTNYPTSMSYAGTMTLVVVMAILLQLLLYAILRTADPLRQRAATPMLPSGERVATVTLYDEISQGLFSRWYAPAVRAYR